MVGTRLLQHRRADMHHHRKATSHLQPVTSPHRQGTNRRRKATSHLQPVIKRHLRVGIRLRLHAVIPHLRVGILCRRAAWPILLWI